MAEQRLNRLASPQLTLQALLNRVRKGLEEVCKGELPSSDMTTLLLNALEMTSVIAPTMTTNNHEAFHRLSTSRLLAEAALDRAHDALYSTTYQKVTREARRFFGVASLLVTLILALQALLNSPGRMDTVMLREALRSLDSAMIMVGVRQCEWGKDGGVGLVHTLVTALEEAIRSEESLTLRTDSHPEERTPVCFHTDLWEAPRLYHPIPQHTSPSLGLFLEIIRGRGGGKRDDGDGDGFPTPCIFHGMLEGWPALTRWCDPVYWSTVAGLRTVPMEVGARYTDDQWTQKLVTFDSFLQDHWAPLSRRTPEATTEGAWYLAQYDLVDQIPRLAQDIPTPDVCICAATSIQEDGSSGLKGNGIRRNVWLGPGGTISPLHHDGPLHNLFIQVMGYKYVRLYGPEEAVYPHEASDMLGNTSRVDVEEPDEEEFPHFATATYVDGIVGPGDILYIPPKWWHYVRSLTPSASVSYWF
ncbi:MAG: hypothetical protein DHS80DRAFT_32671 [Piptocephalis tieghemiana]|nr:MAG: hypothetical protein DHS80DRAFT_32671 [Piptocephalis tieghemiana]